MRQWTLSSWLTRAFWLALVGLLMEATVGHVSALAQSPGPAVPVQTLEESTTQGPVRLTLTPDRQTMTLADRLSLRLIVEAPLETQIQLPEVTAQLGPFRLFDHRILAPQLITPQRRRWQQDYTLEAEMTGTLLLPALTVLFRPEGAAPDTEAQALRTEPYPITVTAIAPPDADVTAPKDIAPPVTLPRHSWPLWVWYSMAVCAGIGLLGALWWCYWRRRRVPAAPPRQPAHLVALDALRRLQRDDLIGQQRVEEFYVRLSAIVRHYIEWRFGLRAPEQTTEEFLAVVLTTDELIVAHRDLLSTFLEHCDLVKFARHQPTAHDMQQALTSAHTFIDRTGDMQVVVAASEAEL